MRTLSAVAFFLLSPALPAASQTQTPAPRPPERVCFRGAPPPRCDTFWITDFQYLVRLNPVGPSYGPPEPTRYLTWELGGMSNAGPRHAFGGALFGALGDEQSHLGMRGRYRRWLDNRNALDLSLGVLIRGEHVRLVARYPSYTAQVGLMHADLIGVAVGVDAIRAQSGGADVAVYAGVRFGSFLGPPVGLFTWTAILLSELGGT
jgi:hypothetical protein